MTVATDIKQVRHFDVTVTLYGDEQRDLPAGAYRTPLRAGGLIFQVGAASGKLTPDFLITVTGRNIRKDRSLGGEGTRLLRRDENPWLAAHVDAAVEQIARDWPGLVTP